VFSIKNCKRSLVFTILFFFVLQGFTLNHASAHQYSASYTTLNFTESSTEMIYSIDELSVIELTNGDVNSNGMLDNDEFDAVKEQFIQTLQDNISLSFNGENQPWNVEHIELDRQGAKTEVIVHILFPAVQDLQSVSLTDKLYVGDIKTNYVNLLTIAYGSQKSTSAISGNSRTWAIQLTESDYTQIKQGIQQPTAENKEELSNSENKTTSGWYSFFSLGMNHILEGIDHLLFLFLLLIARQSFKQYAALITSFTIAHCLTLTLTVIGWIDISPKIVEPAIALSICYVAIENIIRKKVSHRWIMTFVFGLIHGMGFADVLKEMDIPKNELAVDLISFNLGIETVQLGIVVVLLPLLFYFHRWKKARQAIQIGSFIGFIIGAIWLVDRIINA
jgi:hydrogenase/urease accessory protein HupE